MRDHEIGFDSSVLASLNSACKEWPSPFVLSWMSVLKPPFARKDAALKSSFGANYVFFEPHDRSVDYRDVGAMYVTGVRPV
jgi:hypothetical protein